MRLPSLKNRWKGLLLFFAVAGPGIITSNVDNDAGGIATYSMAGSHFGNGLLWSLLPIMFALIVVQEADLPHATTIVLTTYATVGLSVLAHGLTAAPLARRYSSWFASHPADAMPGMESVPAGAHRWRRSQATDEAAP